MTITVVIPTFNRARFLANAIESVFRQEYHDLEIVVIDDGSTDDTRDVVGRYGARVRYVYQPNAGCGAARNAGIETARGDYIAFLDSDDRWADYKLSVQLALLEARRDVGLVFSDFVIEKPGGSVQTSGARRWAGHPLEFSDMAPAVVARPAGWTGPAWPAEPVNCYVGPMYRTLLDELPILTSSVVVRRAALDETVRFAAGVHLFEDWEFFARVARRAPLAYVDLPTTVNVGHPDPHRVSSCDPLTRARCYVDLLERVWLADLTFAREEPEALKSALSRGLLAVSRQALLAGDRAAAVDALNRWRSLGTSERAGWARVYSACAALPAGGTVLRNVLRGRLAAQLVTGRGLGDHPVNPAA